MGGPYEAFGDDGIAFIVDLEAAAVHEPGPGALHDPASWEGDEADRSPNRGEIVLSTRYRRLRGEPFPWLYLAEADLADLAREADFEVESLSRVAGGEYLVALHAARSAGA